MTEFREMKTPSYQRYRIVAVMWLSVLLASCYAGGSSTGITGAARQEGTQPIVTSYPSATQIPVFTPSLSLTASISPTPSPSTTPTPPGYFLSHPALKQVAPPGYWDIKWIDDTHATFGRSSGFGEEWAEYLIPLDPSKIQYVNSTFTKTQTSCCNSESLVATAASIYHLSGQVYEWIDSPDGRKALAITLMKQPTTNSRLGKRNIPPQDGLYFEGWIVNVDEQKASALFYTPEDFAYYWFDNGQHILATSVCYGGRENAGHGSFAIDAQALMIHGLGDNYDGPCEGGVGPSTSPDSLHIIFQNDHGTVETITGTQRVHVCQQAEHPRSYGWSPDGRYVFVACTSSYDQPDELRRFDTQTNDIRSLTDRNKLRFKAIDLVVSPDQTRILFQWGTSNFGNDEPYGIWLLDLQKLDN